MIFSLSLSLSLTLLFELVLTPFSESLPHDLSSSAEVALVVAAVIVGFFISRSLPHV